VKDYTYNFEIKDLLTQFLAAFDDVVIKRYDANRNAKENIEVRYVLAPKQRVMYDIVNKAQNLTLPVVAVSVAGISRDTSRVFNKLNTVFNKIDSRSSSNIGMPVPINIEVNMSILTRYLQDLDQILSNFIPYSNPYIILSWKEPSNVNSEPIEIRSEVLWSGNISLNEPTDISYSEKFRVVADTNFTIKGWLFKNANETSTPIYFIDTNFITSSKNIIVADSDYDTFFNSLSDATESVKLSAIPTNSSIYYNISSKLIEITSDFTLNSAITAYNSYVIYGSNFSRTNKILLSSSAPIPYLSSYYSTISSKYTGSVSGYSVLSSTYNIMNDNMITLDLTNIQTPSVFNIIISNEVGWCNSYDINSFTFTKS
jgi:hypothetical protein